MALSILLLSAAAIGQFISAKSNKTSIILITTGLIFGLILALFPVKELKIPGIYFYLASLLPFFYYGFTIKKQSSCSQNGIVTYACQHVYFLVVDREPLAWKYSNRFMVYFIISCNSYILQKGTQKRMGHTFNHLHGCYHSNY